MSPEWTAKMKELIGDGKFFSEEDLLSIAQPGLKKKDLQELLNHDPLLAMLRNDPESQKLFFDQQGLANAIPKEFFLSQYCVYILQDRQKRTNMFLEETEKDISCIITKNDLSRHISPLLSGRLRHEVHPLHPQYKDSTKTSLHQIATSLIGVKICRMLGLGEEDQRAIALGMLFHDIGKYLLPWEIVNKPSALSAYERDIMQMHPELSLAIMEKTGFKIPEKAMEVIGFHHERLDGSGYPYGIKGIPPLVQVASAVDAFDALIEPRPYRERGKGFTVREALDMMIGSAMAGLLNKEVVDCIVAANRKDRALPDQTGYYSGTGGNVYPA
jgi:HD-GYP domain-containing protein (c-di-GMP phosphodiesterase class II)